jgi:acetyl-CoA C-acetyltransferase
LITRGGFFNMNTIRGKAAIVGIGEVPTGRYPDRTFIEAAVDVAEQAIRSAGVSKKEIETVIPIGIVADPTANVSMSVSWLVEELGLGSVAKSNFQVFSGGSSSSNSLKTAVALVTAGLSKGVLVLHSDRMGTGIDLKTAIGAFSRGGISQEFELPYGYSQLASASMGTVRYMYESGATEREMASVVETLRKWAALHPNAMMRKPKSVDELLDSPIISTMVRKSTMNMLADGASAFIVTSTERARDLDAKPAYVLGLGSRCTHMTPTQFPDVYQAWKPAADDAYEMAGIEPHDVDVAEVYDAYPFHLLRSLEILGLCEREGGAKFFAEGHAGPGGKLPVSTNGAMMAGGHTGAGGGMALMVEGARQVTGLAGERQVKDAKIAVVTATGGTAMDFHVTILGREV